MFKPKVGALLFSLVLLSGESFAQAKKSEAAKAEPMHTLSGILRGRTIRIERPRWIEKGVPLISVKLREARWEGNKLLLSGVAEGAGKVSFTLVGVTARSASPWPSASSDTARKKDAATQDKGEKNEQTQSLHAAAEIGAGCDILFLKMKSGSGGREMQAGVTMAGMDNQEGREINQLICQIAKFSGGGDEAAGKVAELNRLFSRK